MAEGQEGLITRAQLRSAGLSDAKIARWVAEGQLVRRHQSIYTVGHGALSQKGELLAALLYAGEGAALSHTTAAWWWGLIEAEPRRIHVSARHNRVSLPAVRVHAPRGFSVVEHRGLPVTSVPRTVIDVAAGFRYAHVRRLVAEVEFRALARLPDLAAECARGRPGSSAMRRALREHQPELARTRSVLEERLVWLCEEYEIPMPEFNARMCGLTVDALWRAAGVVVELDGMAAHASPARMHKDRRRDLELRAAGLVVQRYTWSQVTRTPADVAADILRALRR
ncbi:MAG TPA: type IV toxin-antitoxin system AbiEi family antitoxin domain-containing protein [Thermoleophilaceae bacterium]|nr:type IV toxin-antitoxin system AbiEi family antitoxin domain-containing protein [Thermoleophilaceae bacterium]